MNAILQYSFIAAAGLLVFFLYPLLIRRYNAKHPTAQIELKPWMRYMGLVLFVLGIVRIGMVLL